MSPRLFEPFQIGKTSLKHRVVMAPLTRMRANAEHVPQPIAIEYYSQRASVPGTLLITESTLVSAAAGAGPYMPGIYTDAQVQAWKKIVDGVHAKGSFIFCQLVALGRAANPELLKQESNLPLGAPSAVPMEEGAVIPEPLSEDQIESIIQDYATAAKNAIAVGFDGVEVHGANGYLPDQFLHDRVNLREDKWGGSVEKRSRFPLEVAKALIEAVGKDRVGFRLSPWNEWQGMECDDPVPQFSYLVREFKQLGLSYLHFIESRVINNVDTEMGGSLKPFLDIWGHESPVLVAGGYNANNVEHAIEEDYRGRNLAVVFGRYFLANPDLPFRIRRGIPLQKYDRPTFYAPMEPKGYADYPFSEEFKAQTAELN